MDTNYIKMHLVIDRYVQGKLTDDELPEFEERLVWDQDLQEQVELAETMRDWLRASVEENRCSIPPKRHPLGWFADVIVAPGYAAAASFVLGVLITSAALIYPETDATFAIEDAADAAYCAATESLSDAISSVSVAFFDPDRPDCR